MLSSASCQAISYGHQDLLKVAHKSEPKAFGAEQLSPLPRYVEAGAVDDVASSLNSAALKHRARLLNRSVGDIKRKVAAGYLEKESGPRDDFKDEDDLRELEEDCQFIQRISSGRLTTMSSSLHAESLNT